MARAIETPWRSIHCPNCGRRLEELAGAARIKCRSCGVVVTAETAGEYITVQACLTTARARP
jgi:transcription initiation factor TFIIIB Brf1 subunit/transcription initiation factor TFIIB